ncbi:sulfite exporter TauE/SafE family protein [Eubacterium multiforme]|uniref:Probable membrane transporter protein n=1 Tax=Eubacterium multiforme TaxID=83339 RepID=A0ABT9UY10_9FIRM|nr:sulfite exporter TauE/SafE family protein [Eubacterium multiforme]MDQ0151201.1 putative membrane protein YfcA [Eubacterium multiforme]
MSIIYFFVCLCSCIVGAISGIGGGVIIKPTLDALGGLSVSTISFLSGCTVLAMTSMTLFRSRNSTVKVDKRKGTLLAVGGAIGGMIGKYIFDLIKTSYGKGAVVGAAQSLLLAVVTIGVLIFTLNKSKFKVYDVENSLACILFGFGLGSISAFMGIGGGPINLAILYLFFAMDSKKAALNSIYIIFFSQLTCFLFTIFRGKVPPFDWAVCLFMLAGGLLGGTIGPMISKKLSLKGVDKVYTTLVVVVIAISIYNFVGYVGKIG